ncbi:hypothetical protein ACV242_003455 [Peribacillus simplex]
MFIFITVYRKQRPSKSGDAPYLARKYGRSRYLRHHQDVKPIYAKRKETIERVFADAKEKHGMRWTTFRGLKKLSMQAMLTFAAMDVKKMANWTWQGPKMA